MTNHITEQKPYFIKKNKNSHKNYKQQTIQKNMENIKQLIQTAKIKLELDKKDTDNWSNGSQTYFEEIQNEIQETIEEYKNNNQIYLEDELGDILWDYINLLINLENENKIHSIEKIFQRANTKYSERINAIQNNISWSEIKIHQKEKQEQEQNQKNKKITYSPKPTHSKSQPPDSTSPLNSQTKS